MPELTSDETARKWNLIMRDKWLWFTLLKSLCVLLGPINTKLTCIPKKRGRKMISVKDVTKPAIFSFGWQSLQFTSKTYKARLERYAVSKGGEKLTKDWQTSTKLKRLKVLVTAKHRDKFRFGATWIQLNLKWLTIRPNLGLSLFLPL